MALVTAGHFQFFQVFALRNNLHVLNCVEVGDCDYFSQLWVWYEDRKILLVVVFSYCDDIVYDWSELLCDVYILYIILIHIHIKNVTMCVVH